MSKTQMPVKRADGSMKKVLSMLGPGLITGAADDDPSGIATYSIAGAQLGTSILWLSLVTWPLMAAVQMMCARIGMVTGRGLGASLSKKVPRSILGFFALALFLANTINIGADLFGMADATNMLLHWNVHFLVVLFGVVITFLTVKIRYVQISQILKWLTLVLFSYVVTVFLINPNWHLVLAQTITPSWPRPGAWGTIVAILGTTISPYLFYWQSAQEVEEAKSAGKIHLRQRQGASEEQIKLRSWDVGIGTLFSNLVMYFIILATALTLNQNGVTNIETSRQAADALRPLAGNLASLFYTLGIIGVGFLAIPTLCGSAAYAFADLFHWRQGLDEPLHDARNFYGVVTLSVILGVALDFAQIKPILALYVSAVINGLLAPFLLVGVLIAGSDEKLMLGQPSSFLCRLMVLLTTVVMFGAAIGMFVF